MTYETSELTDAQRIELIDQLLRELKVDNLGSVMDRPNRRNYKSLLRDGEEIGIVMVKSYDRQKNNKRLKVGACTFAEDVCKYEVKQMCQFHGYCKHRHDLT